MVTFQDSFPVRTREIENLWIPMPDGVRLAARAWLSVDAEDRPVPAILEFIPYRKRDAMARRDEMMHPWFAGHGYASVRVDLRGSGDSEGVLTDEYTAQEHADGLAIVDWLCRQTWCSGAVGIIGISWGGFNGLQIAAHRPPALKAIVTVGSTDDRYADDVHYMGGSQLSSNFTWSQTLYADLTRPPDPLLIGPDWKRIWLERLENARLFVREWTAHPYRDQYWQHGSVCEDFSQIECAVLAVGGWADSYTNAVPRLLKGLQSPRLGIIGPWGHDYPQTAVPGPAIGFLQECVRWWDHWLKDKPSGIMDEPLLRLWMQEDLPPAADHHTRPGRWLGLDRVEAGECLQLHLQSGRLHAGRTEDAAVVRVDTPQTMGWTAGEWCAYGACADQPADQAVEDGLSVVFDTEPLSEAVEIVGTPRLRLRVASSAPYGQIIARLNEVDETGRSARVTYGVLNLAHRDGFDVARPLVPDEMVDIEVKLCDTAYRFQPGRRIRLALSTTYWPTVWPVPGRAALSLELADCALSLPQLDRDALAGTKVSFPPPVAARPNPRVQLRPSQMQRRLTRDFITGAEVLTVVVDDGLQRLDPHGLEVGRRCEERYGIHPDDPLSGWIEADWTMTLGRADWQVRTEIRTTMRHTEAGFVYTNRLEAYEGDELVFRSEE
ncbi:CocE/NonD family hydrolase [Microbaculum sp. FT89]|uniref:CocE/NonD family hydrolase n=1 Tax=Microbaculum sp. FT89 TaxID=3447298 RepID=UPI003F52C57C